ncbi:hypothetical protein C0J52_17090 [Blattella germanica]|nr:hypothetical protein C0J52_17090 [Blattella germanica]
MSRMSRSGKNAGKKPPDIGLQMECHEEALTPEQTAAYNKGETEYKEIQTKLEEIMKTNGAQIIEKGENGSQSAQTRSTVQTRTGNMRGNSTPIAPKPTGPTIRMNLNASTPTVPSLRIKPPKPPEKVAPAKQSTNKGSSVINRPTEGNSIGGLATDNAPIVDLTDDDGRSSSANIADSKEVTFNKLAGKTFPSLVVAARPHLRVKEMSQGSVSQERAALGKTDRREYFKNYMRRKRKEENEEQRENRLKQVRKNMNERRNKETEEMKKRRCEAMKCYREKRKHEETEEMKERRLEKCREAMKKRRCEESEEQRSQRLRKDNDRKISRRRSRSLRSKRNHHD